MLEANTPKFDEETRVVTLPVVQRIQWKVNGEVVDPGQLRPLQEGESVRVEAEPVGRVRINGDREWIFGTEPDQQQ